MSRIILFQVFTVRKWFNLAVFIFRSQLLRRFSEKEKYKTGETGILAKLQSQKTPHMTDIKKKKICQ